MPYKGFNQSKLPEPLTQDKLTQFAQQLALVAIRTEIKARFEPVSNDLVVPYESFHLPSESELDLKTEADQL